MIHTLVTFLGRTGRDPQTGYRQARYRFPDEEAPRETPFFGMALAGHLKPDAAVVLGTSGSQWSVLVEHLAQTNEAEAARLELLDAEIHARVAQPMLDAVAPLMSETLGLPVTARLIPFGKDAGEQYEILDAIADTMPIGDVSFDLTHGFRHLGMVGFLSAFMLERVRNLRVRGLWYGALDMTDRTSGITPVLRLDGLTRVRRWVDALDRFDATGDYGVFAPLLIEDGVAGDKAGCLSRAAFFDEPRISPTRRASSAPSSRFWTRRCPARRACFGRASRHGCAGSTPGAWPTTSAGSPSNTSSAATTCAPPCSAGRHSAPWNANGADFHRRPREGSQAGHRPPRR